MPMFNNGQAFANGGAMQAPGIANQIVQTPQMGNYQAVASPNNWNWGNPQTVSQPPQQSRQVIMQGLPGKIISSPQEIAADDVPMNGTAAVFPMRDDSCIIVKAWTANGVIDTDVYVRQTKEETIDQNTSSNSAQIMEKLTALEATVAALAAEITKINQGPPIQVSKKKDIPVHHPNKEVNENE